MKTCPDCGSKVFRLGCVNCDEANYIAEQEMLTELQYGADAQLPDARDASTRGKTAKSAIGDK